MIELKNVSYQYKFGKNVLDDIDWKINKREIISIIGKNGTGKSTLLKLMAGIMKPCKGEIFVDGINVLEKKNFLEIRKKIGIVFQNPDNQILFPRVYDDIEFALKNLNLDNRTKRVEKALEMVNMSDFKENDTYQLSLGQKQRINIASVLAINPEYIVMDEPTTMIDSKEKENIYKMIKNLKQKGNTVIFVTNNVNEILLSDRICVLENGKIKKVFNKDEILDNIELLEKSDIQIPDRINMILKLKQNDIEINLKDWTMEEIVNTIAKVCRK